MKFGVVEYSSKSGHIWRHCDMQPNYLCDPESSIDPTSFGCYASALSGEHIPLLGFIIGTKAISGKIRQDHSEDEFYISPIIKKYRRVIKKITGSWPSNYPINYFKKFDALLIVHQISDGHEMTSFLSRLKSKYPRILTIGVPTQPYGILRKHWLTHPSSTKDIKEFINLCDVFITIVNSTRKQWQDLSGMDIEYLPQPYPFKYASGHFTPLNKKDKIIFVAGVTNRDNIKLGQIVARKIQAVLPDYIIHMTKIPNTNLDLSNLAGTNYKLTPFLTWQKHLKYLSKTSLVINTDFTQTRGRVQCDCAAVGTPSIGANSDGQFYLFPRLPASPQTTADNLVQQAQALLSDPSFYNEVVRYAQKFLAQYNYIKSARRFMDLYKKYSRPRNNSHVIN